MLFAAFCGLAILLSGVKADSDDIGPTTTEIRAEIVTTETPVTDAPKLDTTEEQPSNSEPLTDSSTTENNDELQKVTTEAKASTDSTTIQNNDELQKYTTEATRTDSKNEEIQTSESSEMTTVSPSNANSTVTNENKNPGDKNEIKNPDDKNENKNPEEKTSTTDSTTTELITTKVTEENESDNTTQEIPTTETTINLSTKPTSSKTSEKINNVTLTTQTPEDKNNTISETINNVTVPTPTPEDKNNSKLILEDLINNTKTIERPNIVFILVDDLGWDDVSFHGSDEIMTPNIDNLAYQSIILNNYYTDTSGTASRSGLLSGKYPLHLGTQGESIKAFEDRGLPTSEQLLPEYLQKLAYKTHLIGKWDIGKSRQKYLPTRRGFDTFYGFFGSSVDYFTYNTIENWDNSSYFGLDFFDNESPVLNATGHLTDVLTDRAKQVIRDHDTSTPLFLLMSHAAPHAGGGLVNLQPPEDCIAPNNHIAHSARRLYAGLVTSLDRSVGHIVSALAERDILRNTLIIFASDNGAPTEGKTQNFGSNLPLRGMKNTPWEGGARSVAFLWHPSLQPQIRQGLFHVIDWLPTIVSAAGGNVDDKIDGINQWEAIKQGHSKRNDILITIDDQNGWAALREGDFKLIVGVVNKEISRYLGIDYHALRSEPPVYEKLLLECETYYVLKETLNITLNVDKAIEKRNSMNLSNFTMNAVNLEPCVPDKDKGCLFNIADDPLENNDLWYTMPDMTKKMSLRLRTLWSELKPKAKPQIDLRANPARNNYIWLPWVPNNETVKQTSTLAPLFPLQVSIGELQYLVDLNLNMFKEKMYESIKYMGNSFMKTVGGLFNFSK